MISSPRHNRATRSVSTWLRGGRSAGVASIVAIAALLILAACDGSRAEPVFRSTDITGAPYAQDFRLTDHNGRARRLSDFSGKVVVVFFGFLNCPEACPTTLAQMASVMKELGSDAERVQVLLVTLDPERDTPERLAQYAPSFHPGFLGLYGSLDATTSMAKDFKIFFQKQPTGGGGYSLDHSTGRYVYDPHGRLRLFISHDQNTESIVSDLKVLLKGQ